MELTEYLSVLRKRGITVVLLTVAGLAVGAGLTLMATPQYQASSRTLITMDLGNTFGEVRQGNSFTRDQMATYAQIAASPMVLEPVTEDLGLDGSAEALSNSVQVSIPENTTILEITVTNASPRQAANIANAVGTELIGAVERFSPEGEDGSQAVEATVLSEATTPSTPISPNTNLNLALGLGVGLLLGIGLAVLRETLDTKVRTDKDIAQLTDSPVIGNIAFEDAGTTHPVFMHADSRGERAEAIRRLRTNLQFVGIAERVNSTVVTSSVPGEGKSTTAINLAISLADAGGKVLLIDADLRKPSVGEYLGLEGRAGLTTVLIGRAELQDVVQQSKSPTLDVLPSGQIPPNPSELLGAKAMATLLERAAAVYDHVIIDSPPLLPVTDAAVLSKLTGGALVIAGADRIQKAQLRESLDALERVDAHILGIVLNKVENRERGKYYYAYGTYDERQTEHSSSDRAVPTAHPDRAREGRNGQPTVLAPEAPAPQSTSKQASFPVAYTERPAQMDHRSRETPEPQTPGRKTWPGEPLASVNNRRQGGE